MPPTDTAEAPTNGMIMPEGYPYKERELAEARLGMQLEEARAKIESVEGRKELIEQLNLNGDAEQVLDSVDLNLEQLKKKESFFMKMLKLPGRTLKATLGMMKRHPIITGIAGVAILIALLYFMPALAPTAGEYGKNLIQSFKNVLAKIGIGTPEAATDAIGNIPITGGNVPTEVIDGAREILQSPGKMQELRDALKGLSQ